MKVCFFLGASEYRSSLYKVTQDVALELESMGHSVDNVFWDAERTELKSSDKNITIKGLSHCSVKSRAGLGFRLIKNLLGKHIYGFFFSRFFCRQIEPLLRQYDAVFIHGLNYLPLHALSVPHYVVMHSCKYDNLVARQPIGKRWIYKKLYQEIYGGKRLLTVSKSVKKDILTKMEVVPKSIETIYNGFDFARMQAIAKTGSTQRIPDKFVMAAGRPDRTKRFDILIKAYAKTKRTHKLVIFGEGRGLEKLRVLAQTLGVADDVIFWGYCSNLLPYYLKASAYILSSDVEGLPTVVVESLVLGTPVVGTDVGGVRELLAKQPVSEQECKWIVPRRDINALAEKIDQVLLEQPVVSEQNIAFLDYKLISQKYARLSEELMSEL